MSDFEPVSERVKKSFDWGNSSVADAWKIGTDLGNTVIDKTVLAFTDTKTYAAETIRAGTEWAKEKFVAQQTELAQHAIREVLKDQQQRDRLVSRVDRRDRFSSRVVRPCGNPTTTHPDTRDGQYMGKDCPNTMSERPAEGVKPAKCMCTPDGKAFPKVIFSNGINNEAKVVCSTMHALAESRCVEVIGVFNATYADPDLKGPERSFSDYKDIAKATLKGAWDGLGSPVGALKGAMTESGLQAASRIGAVQDVIDCIKTINQSGVEASSSTLSQAIVGALSKSPPEPVTLYLHSQGGLNGAAAIGQAKRKLMAVRQGALIEQGISEDIASVRARHEAESLLANVNVNTFGTLERGLPDGPIYHRFTNQLDPVPGVIHEAQQSYAPELIARDPKGAAPATKFSYAPSWSAGDAHGMQETYIPWLDKHDPQQPCC